jgi:hypothetical protein
MMKPGDLLEFLTPPDTESHPRHILRWRWAVVVCVLVVLGDSAGGRGWLPFVPAYAMDTDVTMMLTLQLSEAIQNNHARYCNAKTDSERIIIRRVIDKYQIEFDRLTGERFPLPMCQAPPTVPPSSASPQ